jgi:hypothetical protein
MVAEPGGLDRLPRQRLGFFGGVTRQIVCDNLKAGVIAASRYEPGINRPSGDGGALRHRHRANASAQAA